jgi:hypothetical protein
MARLGRQAAMALIMSICLLLGARTGPSEVHQDPCHQRHAWASDHGTYICGGRGPCEHGPDHPDGLAGQPRPASQPIMPPSSLPHAEVLTAPVLTIVDVDTIDLQLDGRTTRVHSSGLNTPEAAHPTQGVAPFGHEATEAHRRLVEGKTVRLALEVEHWARSRRLRASVAGGEAMVNAEWVCQGSAQVTRFPPHVQPADLCRQRQGQARAVQRG